MVHGRLDGRRHGDSIIGHDPLDSQETNVYNKPGHFGPLRGFVQQLPFEQPQSGDPWRRRFGGVAVLTGDGYGDDGGKDARDGDGEMQLTGSEDQP